MFSCAPVDLSKDQPCWCSALPSLSPADLQALGADPAGSCFCPACLKTLIAARAEQAASDGK